jgi:octaprenyl-diphosphate synthase
MNAGDIFEQYSQELKIVDQQLLNIFKSNAFLIPMVGRHILSSGGKRIRPLLLLLSADLCGYKRENRTLFAAIIEAIHTASLLHDDVIDGAETRRGKEPAHSIWGNQVVILVGDFLYSNALKIAVNQKNQKIMEALSSATTGMTEGEILQLNKIGEPDITQEEYFEIISAKTGALISAACRIAAILSNAPEEQEIALAKFGLKVGIAFQLADDILDYAAKQKKLGKKLGKDLEEGKITMPLLYLLKATAEAEKNEVKNIISQVKEQGLSNHGLKRIIELFSKYNVVEESFKVADHLVNEAKSALDVFSSSKEKEAMLAMADYAIHREQ